MPTSTSPAKKKQAQGSSNAAKASGGATHSTPAGSLPQTNSVGEGSAIISKAISEGKPLVDKHIADFGKQVRLRSDTLTYVCYIEPYMLSAIHAIVAFISDYAWSFRPKLDSDYAPTEIENALLLYTREKYYDSWIARINGKGTPHRP